MTIKDAIQFIDASFPGYGLSGKPPEVAAYKIWLKQIPESDLERCVVEAIRANAPYPNPPNGPAIERVYLLSKKTAVNLTAEGEWQKVEKYARRHWVAGYVGAPPLQITPEGHHALRIIGGIGAVGETLENAPQFTAKLHDEFIENYEKSATHPQLTGDLRNLLAAAEEAKLEIESGADPKEEVPFVKKSARDLEIVDQSEIASTLRSAVGDKPFGLSEEEFAERKRQLDQQLEAAKHMEDTAKV